MILEGQVFLFFFLHNRFVFFVFSQARRAADMFSDQLLQTVLIFSAKLHRFISVNKQFIFGNQCSWTLVIII